MKKLYGVIGEKLPHTYSPQINERIFDIIGEEGDFVVLEIKKEDLSNTVLSLKTLGFKGLSVTIPYKVDLMEQLDYISEEAKKIGAISVIDIKDGKTSGYNADYYGFGMTLVHNEINIKDEKALILGTGGASRAVSQYLLDNGIKEISFASIEEDDKDILKERCKVIRYNEIKDLEGYSIVINCTPVGMSPNVNQCVISREEMKKFKVAVDIIYNPTETLFLKYAKEEGLKSMNGLYMLVAQAVKAQEIWHDKKLDYSMIQPIEKEMEVLLNK